MKIGTRIFVSCILIFMVCFYYPIDWIFDNLRTRYLESVEEPMVDLANILACLVGEQMEQGGMDPGGMYRAFDKAYARRLGAKIYQLEKDRVDAHVYITDNLGRVVFDSRDPKNVGHDFSYWRDVALTLQGRYGARTTRNVLGDPHSSVLYVAAPIRVQGDLAGVLTLYKPTTNINHFLKQAQPRIYSVGLISLAAAIVLSYLFSLWITLPIKRLTRYAREVGQGRRAVFPGLDKSEIGEMGRAFESMQEALEGRKTVESYVQNLTHEIKSPLSAIQGAAELLEEDMTESQRARFLSNIRNEADRIRLIVERLLALAALESRKVLDKKETVAFDSLAAGVLESKSYFLGAKKLNVTKDIPAGILVRGDSFLLHQALSNLIQNAIDFSPEGEAIDISVRREGADLECVVEDRGPGIPEYAREKVFDKFFSLKRPDSGRKSTGLGLNFVREVADLHGGSIRLEPRGGGGVRAVLRLGVEE